MNVTELIAALQALEPDTPVSHELVAELVRVDEAAVYGGGKPSFHPSIYAFRKQRYLRAAAAAKRAIQKLRAAGWDARVTHKSIGDETRFIKEIEILTIPIGPRPDRPWGSAVELRELVSDEMAGWVYDVDDGYFIKEEAHKAKFDDALSLDDIEAGNKEAFAVFATDLLSTAVRGFVFSIGQPLLYESKTSGESVREWPNGRIEIVSRDADGTLVVVRVVAEGSGEES